MPILKRFNSASSLASRLISGGFMHREQLKTSEPPTAYESHFKGGILSSLPEKARKAGSGCLCCRTKVDKRGLCACKTVLD